MPIYEYQCAMCARAFEELIRSGKDERGLRCPNCGSTDVKRQFSVFGMSGTRSGTGRSCASCSAKSCSTCR
ncbi:MAG: zinc ribbon domain-containing protein [Candidatus Latescibacteria bacterium]|nr:zinc ribbon domain-containing protein [Candidatus Latescibacterota bacterium]MCK5328639.1 zinc ribbon domain-containing protein [Candidatus Latescibacterota bacterium]MCK5381365.1 zinc ribbon domain-containing protein [Candidatus Latescibacterota bacterium]